MKFMQQILKRENDIDAVTVFLKLNGTACNMQCAYCYSHVSSNSVCISGCSPSDVCGFLSRYTKYRHVFIVFHGGEPLLTPTEAVKIILNFIVNTFKYNVNIQFQTNGTLINDKWKSLFRQYARFISLSFSIDPDAELDLRVYPQGVGKEQVWKNIADCCDIIDNVGIVSVAHKHNYNSFIPFIKELIAKGIHSDVIK